MGIPRMLLLLLLAALTADLASCQCSLSFTLPNIIKGTPVPTQIW